MDPHPKFCSGVNANDVSPISRGREKINIYIIEVCGGEQSRPLKQV